MITNRCRIYLETGNMQDIKKMKLEDFRHVLCEYEYINTPVEQRTRTTLSDSQKDMIKYHKEHLQKGGKVI